MKKLVNSWHNEKQAAYLYSIMADYCEDANKKQLFKKLSLEADEQAELWQAQLKLKGIQKTFTPNVRAKIIVYLIKTFGIQNIRLILTANKIRGMSVYSMPALGHPMPKTMEDIGQSHQSSDDSNNLRAAIFGINDGLISNTCLLLGMAGAGAADSTLILAGVAGLLAGAFSMSAGEYVSVRSQKEMMEYQIEQEREEFNLYPEEEAAELAIIYQARGLEENQAKALAQKQIQDPEQAIQTLLREELGIDPQKLVSPVKAALYSFLSFMLGAFIPLIPFLLHLTLAHSVILTILLTGLSLFGFGSIISLYTGRSFLKSGFRMLGIGFLAAALTYGIGHVLGTIL